MSGKTVALRTCHITYFTNLGQILDNGCQQILVSNQNCAYIITYSIRMQPVAKILWEHKDSYYFHPQPPHQPERLYLHSIVKPGETINTFQRGDRWLLFTLIRSQNSCAQLYFHLTLRVTIEFAEEKLASLIPVKLSFLSSSMFYIFNYGVELRFCWPCKKLANLIQEITV